MRIPFADDLHCHLRQGDMMALVIRYIIQGGCDRVLVMPNTIPPITTCAQAGAYRRQLLDIEPNVDFLMTLYLSNKVTPDDLHNYAKENNVQGIKCYPVGTTTNSQHGFKSLEEFYPLFSEMERLGLSLHIHGEQPGASPLCAEQQFITHVENVARAFPKLKVVAEHISTKQSIEAVQRIHNLGASVTPHHIFITVDDVLSDTRGVTLENITDFVKDPHLYCKPLAKSVEDRDAIRQAIKSKSEKLFLGSDSAPHSLVSKQGKTPPAGVFTQPFIMNYLATAFKQLDCFDYLEAFACKNGAMFLGLPPKQTRWLQVVEDETVTVPDTIENILVPFMAGKQIVKTVY